ncbi:hypothetical protein [Epilithonimonas hungarica]|uniref:Uncharacterized protein n=1 Tax=Epilithonimonas hungarica TaxID=454006 RepID=A0A1G7LPE9_9FLAO|nr:hypothetical protein [Epilithonimonas hungarica]SDF50829.1 hypothetical protein SAMN05421825_1549 [Epilithonimonas hungarica]
MKEFITFFKDDKEYKSLGTNEIKQILEKIGINTDHHCLIRKKVHIIVNKISDLNLSITESDSEFEKTVKNKIINGNRSFIVVV